MKFMKSGFSVLLVTVLVNAVAVAFDSSLHTMLFRGYGLCHTSSPNVAVTPSAATFVTSKRPFATMSWRLGLSSPNSSSDETVSTTDQNEQLSEEEWAVVKDLVSRASPSNQLEELVTQALPSMHPKLILKLKRQSIHDASANSSDDDLSRVAKALQSVLDSRLASGRDMLSILLNAGEIRKLDAAIGKAAREGRLDVPFFTVLHMNMQDAQQQEQQQQQTSEADKDGDDASANRVQILQHIYTRCQEEVEKTVPPGVALLNKLLRTTVDSIRVNQLQHYLCPQPNVITTPDGKQIELVGSKPVVLVPPPQLVDALVQAVQQIRTVENAGATDRASAASMVESCRQVAREARLVIGQKYGVESEELKAFEDALMPVFRPSSPESPFIQGL